MTLRPEDVGMSTDGPIRRQHYEPIEFAEPGGLYGLMAEFTDEDDLMSAVRAARAAGYTRMDAFTPYPVEGLPELVAPPVGVTKRRDRQELIAALKRRDGRALTDWLGRFNLVALLTLGAGITGAIVGYGLQLWSMALWYPYMNIGGRPYNSWPYYLPITYELTILFASLTAIISMIVLNGLPQPYHPVFNVPEFARATQDRFFLLIQADDPQFNLGQSAARGDMGRPGTDRQGTRQFLESLAPGRVYDADK